MPTWLENPLLTYIGVSAYFSLTSRPERVDPSLMPILWYDDVETLLDNTSRTPRQADPHLRDWLSQQ